MQDHLAGAQRGERASGAARERLARDGIAQRIHAQCVGVRGCRRQIAQLEPGRVAARFQPAGAVSRRDALAQLRERGGRVRAFGLGEEARAAHRNAHRLALRERFEHGGIALHLAEQGQLTRLRQHPALEGPTQQRHGLGRGVDARDLDAPILDRPVAVLEALRVFAPHGEPAVDVLEVVGCGAEADGRVAAAGVVLVRADVEVVERGGSGRCFRLRARRGQREDERGGGEPAHHWTAEMPFATALCFAASPPVQAAW